MARRPQRVLVLGATGQLGQAVLRQALSIGDEVTALTRRTDPPELRGLGVNVVRMDEGLTSLAGAAAGHDVIVDAAAPYPLDLGVPGSDYWQTQVNAAVCHIERVIEAARRHGLRLAFASSCATLPRRESPVSAAEALWRRSISPYFEVKTAMENAVLAAARAGLPAVIVNPAVFLGPWEFRDEQMSIVRLVLAGRLPVVMDRTICVVDVRDVAAAIDRALSHELFGRPVPLAGHNVTLQDLVSRTAWLAGMPAAPPWAVDSGMLAAGAFWSYAAFAAFGVRPPEYLSFIPLIPDVPAMEPSPEQIELGVRIRPLEETLRDSIAFHRERLTA